MLTLKNNLSRFLLYPAGRIYVVIMTICLVLSATLGAYLPKLMNELTMAYADKNLFVETLKMLAFLFTATYLNRSFYNVVVNKYVVGLIQHVRSTCYSKWLLSYELQTSKDNKKEKYPQGEVLARLMTDTESLRELVTSGTFGIFIDAFFVIFSLLSFIGLNQYAGSALGIVELTACVLLIWGSKYMREVFLNVRKARSRLYRTVADIIGGVRETYYIDSKKFASKKSLVVFDDYLTQILKSNVWDASYYSVAESLFPIFLVFAVFIIPISGMKEVGLIFAFIDVIQRSIGPIKDMSSKVANIQRAITGIMRIHEFETDLDKGPSTDLGKDSFSLDIAKARFQIEYFSYARKNSDNPFVLRDIYFQGQRGELIGIVGLSGSGKSTLLNILCANILPDKGEIDLCDGDGNKFVFNFHDEKMFDDYRELIGIVSQESHVFSESLEFNITMGHQKEQSFKDFWSWVSEQIPYIKEWGMTGDSMVNPNELSLGQKQLLAAIRSCYLKKPIVLFDEISSSLDSNLEFALRQMVLLVQKNALTFIVAHRLETIVNADQILVMQDGELVAKGDHLALLNDSSIYRQFIKEISHSH
jgi:ABC-type multidrug transport system fused ATPase/permease subunit